MCAFRWKRRQYKESKCNRMLTESNAMQKKNQLVRTALCLKVTKGGGGITSEANGRWGCLWVGAQGLPGFGVTVAWFAWGWGAPGVAGGFGACPRLPWGLPALRVSKAERDQNATHTCAVRYFCTQYTRNILMFTLPTWPLRKANSLDTKMDKYILPTP